MLKNILFLAAALFSQLSIHAQEKVKHLQEKIEHLELAWPPEYKWKIIKEKSDSTIQFIMMIPGYEKVQSATILGVMRAYMGLKYPSAYAIVADYKQRIDTGSVLTVMERNEKSLHPWIIFKVETPVTEKYPIPESDLYFVVQGDYAFYENFVSIKEPKLTDDFIEKWSAIFKKSSLNIQ